VTLAFAFRRLHFAERCIDGETFANRRKVPVSRTKQLVLTAVREIPESFIKLSEVVELIPSILDRVGNDNTVLLTHFLSGIASPYPVEWLRQASLP
jgi:hypothetical protein